MNPLGMKEPDGSHDEVERDLPHLTEQDAQVGIDPSVEALSELRRLADGPWSRVTASMRVLSTQGPSLSDQTERYDVAS